MRKQIVAGNWKLNTNLQEAAELAIAIDKKLKENPVNKETGIVIAPPFTHLATIAGLIDTDRICLTAQNCASETGGAYTGEISVEMLKSVGVRAVITGHSERRAYYGDTDEILNKKVKLIIAQGLKPIFCCGETLEQREANKQFDIVKSQIENALFDLSKDDFLNIKIAYEPVWAIGTGKTASPDQAQEIHAFIRKTISEKYGNEVSENITILYGGSVKPSNAKELFAKKDIDGGLIGGASLDAQSFYELCNSVSF